MATQQLFQIYNITLGDAALVAEYQAQFPNGVTGISPEEASSRYSAPIGGVYGTVPRINCFGINGGISLLGTDQASASWGVNQSLDGYGRLVSCPGNLAGTVSWLGNFLFEAVGIDTNTALSNRRFICGWEIPPGSSAGTGEGSADSSPGDSSRDASRVVGGRGKAIRDDIHVTQFTLSADQDKQWDRLYIRLRSKPSANTTFWHVKTASYSPGLTFGIGISTAGALVLYDTDDTNLNATGPTLNIGRWYKLDLVYSGFQLGTQTMTAYLNGSQALSGTTTAGSGSTGIQTLTVGCFGDANDLELDIDDWTGRVVPTLFDGQDWVRGSHIEHFVPDESLVTGTGWTGIGGLQGDQVLGLTGNVGLSSSTPGSTLQSLMNYRKKHLGVGAFEVSVYNGSAVTSTNPTLGWWFASNNGTSISTIGSADVASITLGANTWGTRLYQGPGTVDPLDLEAFYVLYSLGSAPSGTQVIQGLQAAVEYIGDFGPEDNAQVQFPANRGPHNSPYPQSPWANSLVPPMAPLSIMAGTYVGSGTSTALTFTQPIHWLFVRPTSGSGGFFWWSSMVGAHKFLTSTAECNHSVHVLQNRDRPLGSETDFNTTILIVGDSSNSNANGTTYQYVAVSDPGQIYMTNGAYAHSSGLASGVNSLPDGNFLPECVFIHDETADSTTTTKHYFKGLGHATDTASKLDVASSSSIATLAQGSITTLTAVNAKAPQNSYSAWRSSFDSTDGMIDVITYTGNGGGARSITVDLNGRSPLFVLIVPHNGGSYFKDPSHASTTSQKFDGTTSTTAITGGSADTVTIGTTLNTNTIVYELFVLGSNGGAFTNPPDGPYFFDPPPLPPDGPYLPLDLNGWWFSDEGFQGAAGITTESGRPKPPRAWDKLSTLVGDNNPNLGGFPAASALFNNHIIYPGNGYTVGTDAPLLRIFDGISDRELVRLPKASTNIPKAIVSLMRQAGTIYLTTYDTNVAGRVFTYDPLSNQLQILGDNVFTDAVPYALVWHMGRLWVGSNKGDGSVGKLYFIRPDIDTTYTLDRNVVSSDSMNGICSLASFQGSLFVGTEGDSGTFAKILKRATDGTYSTSLTATGGTAQDGNGFLHMLEFQNNLYATYWNPDGSGVAKIYKFDGTTWTTAYTGSGTTIRPFILQFLAINKLYIVGGGSNHSACLVMTEDGSAFTNLTAFLSGPAAETSIPAYGIV